MRTGNITFTIGIPAAIVVAFQPAEISFGRSQRQQLAGFPATHTPDALLLGLAALMAI
jgi:hypothetical protein